MKSKVTYLVSYWVTRSPIELSWTAKKEIPINLPKSCRRNRASIYRTRTQNKKRVGGKNANSVSEGPALFSGPALPRNRLLRSNSAQLRFKLWGAFLSSFDFFQSSNILRMMRRCLVRLQAATQKGLEVPSSSQRLNTSTSRTITSKQGIVSSDLPDVFIPSVQLTPLVLDRATRWEIDPVSLMLLEFDNSGWSKFDPWPKGLKSLTTIQDQVQDWKVWPLTNTETKKIEKSDYWPSSRPKES